MSECVSVCPESAPFANEKQCVMACPSGYFNLGTRECITAPTDMNAVRLVPDTTSGTFGVLTSTNCPNGLYSHKSGSNSLCVESCAAYGLAIDGLACSATCSNNDYVMQPTNGELIC